MSFIMSFETVKGATRGGESAALLAGTLNVLEISIPAAEAQYAEWLEALENPGEEEDVNTSAELNYYCSCQAARLWGYLCIAYATTGSNKFGAHLETCKRFQQ